MTATSKTLMIVLTLSIPIVPITVTGAELAIGDSLEAVQAILGNPRGSITSGTYQLLQFERGRVELRDGVVAKRDIVSVQEARARQIRRKQLAEARRIADAERRAQRYAEGMDARHRASASDDFEQLSGREQMNFWQRFRKRYPNVRVDIEYAAAVARDRRDVEDRKKERRLAEMERRIEDAEARARDAERQAEERVRRSRRTYVTYASPFIPVYGGSTSYCRTPVSRISYVSNARYAPHITRTSLGHAHGHNKGYGHDEGYHHNKQYGHNDRRDRRNSYACNASPSYVTYRYPTYSRHGGTSHSRITIGY